MARQLMPKAGIMMPYIVASREAAVVGVSTVDGRAGDILLDATYLSIAKANTDFAKASSTYTKTEVNNLLAPIISNAVIKTDPFINNNVPLRSGGGNGVTSVDLIKADQNNQIVIGDLAAGVQGVNIYSNGRMSVVDKDDAGQTRVSPLYSKRYRPEIADMPFAAIGSYVLDSQGKVIGVNKTGINTDIKSLSGITSKGKLIEDTNIVEAGVKWTSSDTTGFSFGVENTNGGSSVLHNFSRGANNSATPDGFLSGGYGSRPWDGSAYSAHSSSAIHFIQDGVCSPTNHGTWMRFMVTPRNMTQDGRFAALTVSNSGDIITGNGVPAGMFTFNTLNLSGRGYKQINHNASEIVAVADIPSGAIPSSVNFRGVPISGYFGSPGRTLNGSSVFLSFSGHDGVDFQNANAAISLNAAADWSATSRPTVIRFSTTATNETNRVDRWEIRSNILTPVADNQATLGGPSTRVSTVYAANGTIQTSDARLKTQVRPFTQEETEAAKEIAKEIGFFSWLNKVEEEGSQVREHCGLTVQRAISILEKYNLNPFHYGFICFDEWEEEEVVVGYDKNDTPIKETKEAGNRYSFRVDQLNLFLSKGMEARLSELERAVSKI